MSLRKNIRMQIMKIKFFTVGGTIDKVYFDRKNDYQIGDSRLFEILKEVNVGFEYECESILRKDSLDITDEERQIILGRVAEEKMPAYRDNAWNRYHGANRGNTAINTE